MSNELARTTNVVSDLDAPSDRSDDPAVVIVSTDELVEESPTHSTSPASPAISHLESPLPDLEDDEDEDPSRTDADEALDALIDGVNKTLENFLVAMEQRLLNGQSIIATRIWARKNHNVDAKSYARYLDIIRGTWRLEGTTLFVIQTRRDEYRAMYREIYREAREGAMREDGIDARALAVGLKALDAMAALDGLTSPDVTVQINQMIAQSQGSTGLSQPDKVELTNRVRERTQLLLQTMRDRAVQHSAMATRAVQGIQGVRARERGHESSEGTLEDPLVVPSSGVMGVVK